MYPANAAISPVAAEATSGGTSRPNSPATQTRITAADPAAPTATIFGCGFADRGDQGDQNGREVAAVGKPVFCGKIQSDLDIIVLELQRPNEAG